MLTSEQCRPQRTEPLKTRLMHDLHGTYFKFTVGYIAVVLTLIFVTVIADWRI